MTEGMVYLVGAGPGDWRLLTLRGKELLEKADTVVTDHLADPQLLRFARRDAEIIYVGKTADHHTLRQEEINALLVKLGQDGKTVVRLKGGDPLVFGRGSEEGAALHAAGVPFEIVPGISSTIAAPAYAGIPVTDRAFASSFAVITGHEDPAKGHSSIHWEHLATAVDTLVFVMGVRNLPNITEKLLRYGRAPETPVALIRWGTRRDQTTLVSTLAKVADDAARAKLTPPAVCIIGDVVKRRQELRWFDTQPLFGLTIGVTRTSPQAFSLTRILEEKGAASLEIPAIRLEAPADGYAGLDAAISRLFDYNWLVFTSANGVDHFFARLHQAGCDSRALGQVKFAVIGPSTANALETYGLRADVMPKSDYRGESLADALIETLPAGAKVLLVRAEKARAVLPDRLTEAGAAVTIAAAYRTVPALENKETLVKLLKEKKLDLLTCTSSSTVLALIQLLGPDRNLLKNVGLACIGPITAQACHDEGLTPALVADTYTSQGLAKKIQEWRLANHEVQ